MQAGSVEYYECILKNLAEKILRDCADKCDVNKEIYQLFRNLEALLVVLYYYDPSLSECLYKNTEVTTLRDGIDRLIRNYAISGNCENCKCS